MDQCIISVKFWTGNAYDSKEYSYYTTMQLKPGNIVIVPVAKNERTAMVVKTNISSDSIDKEILPLLKTVKGLARFRYRQK